jgi:hypothetical protein
VCDLLDAPEQMRARAVFCVRTPKMAVLLFLE